MEWITFGIAVWGAVLSTSLLLWEIFLFLHRRKRRLSLFCFYNTFTGDLEILCVNTGGKYIAIKELVVMVGNKEFGLPGTRNTLAPDKEFHDATCILKATPADVAGIARQNPQQNGTLVALQKHQTLYEKRPAVAKIYKLLIDKPITAIWATDMYDKRWLAEGKDIEQIKGETKRVLEE